MLRPILLIAAATVAFGPSTAAAETWNGAYVGVHSGMGYGEVDQPWGDVGEPFDSTGQTAPEVDGRIYGVQGGFNWNSSGSSWVLGGEVQGTWGDREGDDGGTGGDVNGVDINSEWSVRGRAGFLVSPNFLLYGTVGFVTMDVDATAPAQGAVNENIDGWTYGVGGEWAFHDRWSGFIEWRTDEMDQTRFSFPIDGYDEGLTPETSALRIGLNWHS